MVTKKIIISLMIISLGLSAQSQFKSNITFQTEKKANSDSNELEDLIFMSRLITKDEQISQNESVNRMNNVLFLFMASIFFIKQGHHIYKYFFSSNNNSNDINTTDSILKFQKNNENGLSLVIDRNFLPQYLKSK